MVDMGVLLQLQQIDTELSRIGAEHGNIPAELEELESDFLKLSNELEKAQEKLKKIKVAIGEAEGKIALLEETAKKYDQQLLAVKTNREYSALLTEIESVKKEKSELEDSIIKNMEKAESVSTVVDKKSQKLEELSGELNGKKKEMNGKLKELDVKMSVHQDKRKGLVVKVQSPVLTLYERIMNSKIKQAVVAMKGGSCGGCFAMIPLQKVADIRSANSIYTCDHCGRIMYYEENS